MATEQSLERVRPQQQALARVADDLGIVTYIENTETGAKSRIIDLSRPELAERFNVLAPAAMLAQGDANFTPAINIVRIDPDPNAGDVYAIDVSGYGANRKINALALLKPALEKIGGEAGIETLPPKIEHHGDDLTVTAFLRLRRPDGTFKTLSGSREWVREDEYEDVENQCPTTKYNSDKPLSPEERAAWIKKRWTQVKKFRLPMTESKAMLRAYRSALSLKQKYTPEELRKPFLVVSTHFTPDTSDIRILGMLMTGGAQAETALFGPAPDRVAIPAGDEPIEGHVAEEEELQSFDEATGEINEPARPKPANDPVLPDGPHKGKPLSEVARSDPDYTRETLLKSTSPKWGLGATEWLKYWAAEGGDDGVAF